MGRSDRRPGWTYNPSSWPQRLPIIALALIGFAIAGYQLCLGVVITIWRRKRRRADRRADRSRTDGAAVSR